MKKALMIASMASMLDNFNADNMELLHKLNYKIVLAANFKTEDSNSQERVREFRQEMQNRGYCIKHIDFTRKLSNIKGQLKSYQEVKKLSEASYVLVHCHSPICAALTRFAFRKKRKEGLKIIYTAHGFHFYRGAPLKNWFFYFPVEWICSHWTDTLITINKEDFHIAKKFLKAKRIRYIPGVGINFKKFQCGTIDREEKRRNLGLNQDDIMLLSVGELSKRKNHIVVINALKKLNNLKYKYFICGIGLLEAELKKKIKELQLETQVFILGYREDISELCQASNLFIFPSLQEGLPVALMEAIAVKAPVICSEIRGNTELVKEREFLFNPYDEEEVARCIEKAISKDMADIKEHHYELLKRFDIQLVLKKMENYYKEALDIL